MSKEAIDFIKTLGKGAFAIGAAFAIIYNKDKEIRGAVLTGAFIYECCLVYDYGENYEHAEIFDLIPVSLLGGTIINELFT